MSFWSMVTPRMLTVGDSVMVTPLNIKGQWLECLLLVMVIAWHLCGANVTCHPKPGYFQILLHLNMDCFNT